MENLKMSAYHHNSIQERVFVIQFENATQDNLLQNFDFFQDFCQAKGGQYERKAQWNVEIDTDHDVPQIKDGSCQVVEHHFRFIPSQDLGGGYYIFRIIPDGIVFNAVQIPVSQASPLDYMKEVFNPIWSEFYKNACLPEKCRITLCYALQFNSETLRKDPSLFRPNWLEVKEISSLFGGIKDFHFPNQYEHPFSCLQNWSTTDERLGKISLSCRARSLFIKKMLSLQFLLEASCQAKVQEISSLNWNYLFDYLSQVRNVVVMDKALRATDEEWK